MRVHLIGIAGTAMASLARLLHEAGDDVRGSDADIYPPMSTELESLGIPVALGYGPDNLDPAPDLVVVGNAIGRGNPELEACLDRGLPYTSQAEAIEDRVLPGRTPIVITGTHGKTTTTSLVAWLLQSCGLAPGWLIGGVPQDLGRNASLGAGHPFVLEGDEYDTAYFDKRPKFHHYRPRLLVVGNLEFDHADIYPDLASIELEFRRLVNTVPSNGALFVGADSPSALEVTKAARCPRRTYGFTGDADIVASDVVSEASGTTFRVRDSETDLGRFALPLLGRHNVLNALAGIALARHLELPLEQARKALAGFNGVRRRLELVGTSDGIDVYDDFAHHPTAIRGTLEALRSRDPSGRLWAILEPRSWSMRRNLHQDTLAPALLPADLAIIAPVFQRERVPEGLALDVEAVIAELGAAGRTACGPLAVTDIIELVVRDARPGDVIVVMSNGGFDGIHRRLLDALEQRIGSPTTVPSLTRS